MSLEDAKTQVDLAFTRKDRRGLAFENAFGVSVDTFYEKLTPHFQWIGKTYG